MRKLRLTQYGRGESQRETNTHTHGRAGFMPACLKGHNMGRKSKKFTKREGRLIIAAARRNLNFSESAEFIGISRNTLYTWRKSPEYQRLFQIGRKRAERAFIKSAGFDADKTINDFERMKFELDEIKLDFEIEEKEGYITTVTYEDLPDGSVKQIVTQEPEPLPSFDELKKQAIKRRKGDRRGLYDFRP